MSSLPVSAARPVSVICFESRFREVNDVMVAMVRRPLSIIPPVKERFKLSSFFKPGTITNKSQYLKLRQKIRHSYSRLNRNSKSQSNSENIRIKNVPSEALISETSLKKLHEIVFKKGCFNVVLSLKIIYQWGSANRDSQFLSLKDPAFSGSQAL